MNTKTTTQIFELRNILVGHCGEVLSPEKIDQISKEMEIAVTSGPCAWAFASVLDEDPMPRSERLEKLTAERDALLRQDGGADES